MPKTIRWLVELIVVPVLLGWLMLTYPEMLNPVVPWLFLALAWYLTWEHLLSTKPIRRSVNILFTRWGKMSWALAFLVGGGISIFYLYGIRTGLAELRHLHSLHAPKEGAGEQQFASPNVVAVPGKCGMFFYSDLSGSYLYVKLTLENRGSFVHVQTFLANLQTPSAQASITLSSILDGYNWVNKDGSIVYTFHTDKDSLEEKAAQGFGLGEKITGWLKFDLGGLNVPRKQVPLVKLILKAKYDSGALSNAIVISGGSPADASKLLTQQ